MKDVNALLWTVYSEFSRVAGRTVSRSNKVGKDVPKVTLSHEINSQNLNLIFTSNNTTNILSIPIPKVNGNGVEVINSSDCVTRVLNTYMVNVSTIEGQNSFVEKDYFELLVWILTSNIYNIYPDVGNTTLLERIVRSAFVGNLRLVIGQTQRFIDSEIINVLPINETPMNNWAMNKRVVFVDPIFDKLAPDQVLEYQVEKNLKWFPWTSIGLSDGVLVKNYILKEDMKKYTPYGEKLHNPQRNLYQTLGMKGDSTPILETESAYELSRKGIVRKGWTLMTAFLDIPETFEDQIVVDNRLKELGVIEYRKFTSHGAVLVKKEDELVYGAILSIEPSGEEQLFEVHADRAFVESIEATKINIGGTERSVQVITVALTRKFKEGTKITNRHGNKGVIRFADLGYVIDPVRGKVPLDVIVAGKSVQRRKNFGQIIEALTTLVLGKDRLILISDSYSPTLEQVSRTLLSRGYRTDGTCDIETSFGNFKAVCGWVFWGVSKNPEDQIWTTKETRRTDVMGLRQAGNKISTIEIRTLITEFGINNGIVKEILNYGQGQELVLEELMILKSMCGEFDPSLPVVEPDDLTICEDGRIFNEEGTLDGTIHDSDTLSIGGYFKLPLVYYTATSKAISGPVYEGTEPPPPKIFNRYFQTDKIYIPSELLRRSWKHKSGLLGLTPIGAILNRLIMDCKRYKQTGSSADREGLARSLHRYFSIASSNLGGKKGHMSSYGMAIRYPNSVKGVAVQKSVLPTNTVEIHKSMARALGISHGDLVLCERFPCLGFPSLRVQKVFVAEDPECKYVIRVSGNSLVSQGLDFDGDVIYLMSFFTEEAKKALREGFSNPHPLIEKTINEMNGKKVPTTEELTLHDYGIVPFDPLTAETQADLVRKATGVKAHTGPVIALCYNLMRIIETSAPYSDKEFHINMEIFMDRIGKSVFHQKHGINSLQAACTEAICTADSKKLVDLGFGRRESEMLCATIKHHAAALGIRNLVQHYQKAVSTGNSKIINLIVRNTNKIYFASRSKLHGIHVLEHLKALPTDVPSHMFNKIIQPHKLGEEKFTGMIHDLKCKIASKML